MPALDPDFNASKLCQSQAEPGKIDKYELYSAASCSWPVISRILMIRGKNFHPFFGKIILSKIALTARHDKGIIEYVSFYFQRN